MCIYIYIYIYIYKSKLINKCRHLDKYLLSNVKKNIGGCNFIVLLLNVIFVLFYLFIKNKHNICLKTEKA